jgi:hypothetical protein
VHNRRAPVDYPVLWAKGLWIADPDHLLIHKTNLWSSRRHCGRPTPSAHAGRTGRRWPSRTEASRHWPGGPAPTARPAAATPGFPPGEPVTPRTAHRCGKMSAALRRWHLRPRCDSARLACPPDCCLRAADLAHQQLVGSDQRERRPCGDHPPGSHRLGHRHVRRQARHTAGHQQRTRQQPTPPPERESASKAVEAATIIRPPIATSAPPPTRLPMPGDQLVHVQAGDCARNHRHTSDRRPPDPPIRPACHDRLPSASSPVSTPWFFGAIPPRTP